MIKCVSTVSTTHVKRLFDLIPGLEDFTIHKVGKANEVEYFLNFFCFFSCLMLFLFLVSYLATYENGSMAQYAMQKLNKYQYPSGELIEIYNYDLMEHCRTLTHTDALNISKFSQNYYKNEVGLRLKNQ